jgi:hypothetical protein
VEISGDCPSPELIAVISESCVPSIDSYRWLAGSLLDWWRLPLCLGRLIPTLSSFSSVADTKSSWASLLRIALGWDASLVGSLGSRIEIRLMTDRVKGNTNLQNGRYAYRPSLPPSWQGCNMPYALLSLGVSLAPFLS